MTSIRVDIARPFHKKSEPNFFYYKQISLVKISLRVSANKIIITQWCYKNIQKAITASNIARGLPPTQSCRLSNTVWIYKLIYATLPVCTGACGYLKCTEAQYFQYGGRETAIVQPHLHCPCAIMAHRRKLNTTTGILKKSQQTSCGKEAFLSVRHSGSPSSGSTAVR